MSRGPVGKGKGTRQEPKIDANPPPSQSAVEAPDTYRLRRRLPTNIRAAAPTIAPAAVNHIAG
ncbi:hypothetical protein GCM10010172_01200 [Paractinoplanes ferrugineus]|uniref:Uncharacterized protein n=1 Tax=Paractinoplanes ferrugineus TaxID=113564 RepID=A0A919MN65_9ACTN|nr:hypothetical protein Afe05nite_58070 [Actinoplanes ferrugineus]